MTGFMADFEADLAQPFAVPSKSGAAQLFSTWNVNDQYPTSGGIYSVTGPIARYPYGNVGFQTIRGQKACSGMAYVEFFVIGQNSGSSDSCVGVTTVSAQTTAYSSQAPNRSGNPTAGYLMSEASPVGYIFANGSNVASYTGTPGTANSLTDCDVIGIAVDAGGKVYLRWNGTWINDPKNGAGYNIGALGQMYLFASGYGFGDMAILNTGQNQFVYPAPAGYSAWG